MNKPKHLAGLGFGLAVGLLIWIFRHAPESAQQILAYVGVGAVVAALVWGMWRFRAEPERKSEPPDVGSRTD